MSALKQRVGGRALRAFGNRVEVCETERLSPRLRRIRFTGQAVSEMSWSAGDKIKLRIADSALRSYTPARVDTSRGWMDVIVHLHGNGPAAAWAESLHQGDEAWFIGPKTSMRTVARDFTWALFFGDETALGLAQALIEAHAGRVQIGGAIEIDPHDIDAVQALGCPLTAVPRSTNHGDALLQWLANTPTPEGKGIVWLSGEAGTVLRLRTALLERGLTKRQLRIKPYWSLRGAAHRKELERGALRG